MVNARKMAVAVFTAGLLFSPAFADEAPGQHSSPVGASSTQSVTHFSVAGDDYVAPRPDGYCVPSGPMSQMQAMVADVAQHSHLDIGPVWISCNAKPRHLDTVRFAVIGAEGAGEKIVIDRGTFVSLIAGMLRTQAGRNAVAETLQHAAEAGGQSNPSAVRGPIQIIANDNDALYVQVEATRNSSAGSVPISMVEAMTLMNGRLVMVVFGLLESPRADDADLLMSAEQEIKAILAANPTAG